MSIMTSHEEYCTALNNAVKDYTLEELYDYLKKTSTIERYQDYAEIYKIAIKARESKQI